MKRITVLLIGVLIVMGCGRKWKLTAPVSFSFFTGLTELNHDEVEVEEGTLHFFNVSCSGKREKGADVEFSNALNDEKSIQEQFYTLNFDLPQGTYNELEIEYTIGGNTILEGKLFIEDSMQTEAKYLYFKILINQPLNLKARLTDFSISKDKNYTFLLSFNENTFNQIQIDPHQYLEYEYDANNELFYLPVTERKNVELYNQIIKALQDNFILSVN